MNNSLMYNKARAADKLECLALECIGSNHTQPMIANLTLNADWVHGYQAKEYGPICRLKVVPAEAASDTPIEEAVMMFHGVIQTLNLPLFNEKPNKRGNQARYVRQSVGISGLETETFQKVVDNVAEIHALFSCILGRDEVAECGMIASKGDEMILQASNHYFTPKKDACNAPTVLLTQDIDPYGYLAHIGGKNYVHTKENYIYYFEYHKVLGMDDYSPIKFRVGDIVEVEVSFVLLTLCKGKKKTSMVLRSLLLLDRGITHRSLVNQITKQPVPKVTNVLKCQVGYGDEEELRSKMRLLEIGTPVMVCKVGYIKEEISEASAKLSEMEIDNHDVAVSEAQTLD